ncbi:hypothetical protein HDU96_008584 [Phlyctochytrium bullatum]|nr:hypothetical protein HDU96_008584 [Phlyctochytrium bullatum]
MKTRSQFLASDGFLRARDNPVKARLLKSPDSSSHAGSVEILEHRDGCILMGISKVLSETECSQILNLDEPTQYKSLGGKYEISKRRGARLLTLDEHLAELLWNRLSPLLVPAIKNQGLSTTPLGFAVSGEWGLKGVNEAVRLNIYKEEDDFFAPHFDSQFCPNGDERSLFSLVIYLNDGFEGGETVFHFPKAGSSAVDTKGLTVDEEISRREGLAIGYDPVVVKPKTGTAIVFNHNILHEARAFRGGSGQRCLLRTDVLVRREQRPRGFAVSQAESPDYQLCLAWFREAQHQELKGNLEKAGELYERSLSVRFSYPKVLRGSDLGRSTAGKSLFDRLGRSCWIKFDDARFFKENVEGCCRAAAIIAFSQLGHGEDEELVTVAFNPVTQTVKAVRFEELVAAAFFNKPCYGAVFALDGVSKEEAEEELEEAFADSVDRTYMMYRFGAQFIGKDFVRNAYTHTGLAEEEEPDENYDGGRLYPALLPAIDGFREVACPYPHIIEHWGGENIPYNRTFIERFYMMCESLNEMDRLIHIDDYDGSLGEFYTHATTRNVKDDQPELATRYLRGAVNPGTSGKRDVSTFIDANRSGAPCLCGIGPDHQLYIPKRNVNDMVFDFSRNELRVFPDYPANAYPDTCSSCSIDKAIDQPFLPFDQGEAGTEVLRYRVDITVLTAGDSFESFNHASCQCAFPSLQLDMLECVKYTHLDHVHLRCCEDQEGNMFVMAIYGGIVAL